MKVTKMTVANHVYFAKSIGYWRKDKNSPRKQRRWMLGHNEADAILLAARIKSNWQRVVKERKAHVAGLRAIGAVVSAAEALPEWTAADIATLEGRDYQEELAKANKMMSFPPSAEDNEAANVPTSKVVAEWLASKAKGLTLRNLSSIKQSTVNRYGTNIDACIRPFPEYALLSSFDAHAISVIHDYWLGKDHSQRTPKAKGKNRVSVVSERLAINYLRDFKALLTWAGTNTNYDFTPPKELGAWRFKLKKSTPITPTTAELKIILQHASPRLKAYILLALNAGQLAVDIGILTSDHIVPSGKVKILHKRRVKTEGVNDFRGSWELWPETIAAIEAVKAATNPTNNPDGLLFLNADGNPVHYVQPGCTSNTVGEEFRRTVKPLIASGKVREGVDFKSLRAWGASWIGNAAKTEYLAKIYLAHAVASSATQAYVNTQYDLITPWLRKMRAELKNGKVI